MPFNPNKLAPPDPNAGEGPLSKVFRLFNKPIAEMIPGVKGELDKFAQPGLKDVKAQETATDKPIIDPRLDLGSGIPTPAEMKGFFSGAAGAVTPALVAQAASLGSGTPAMIANSLMAAENVHKAADPTLPTSERVLNGVLAPLAGAGAASGFLKGAKRAGQIGKDIYELEPTAQAGGHVINPAKSGKFSSGTIPASRLPSKPVGPKINVAPDVRTPEEIASDLARYQQKVPGGDSSGLGKVEQTTVGLQDAAKDAKVGDASNKAQQQSETLLAKEGDTAIKQANAEAQQAKLDEASTAPGMEPHTGPVRKTTKGVSDIGEPQSQTTVYKVKEDPKDAQALIGDNQSQSTFRNRSEAITAGKARGASNVVQTPRGYELVFNDSSKVEPTLDTPLTEPKRTIPGMDLFKGEPVPTEPGLTTSAPQTPEPTPHSDNWQQRAGVPETFDALGRSSKNNFHSSPEDIAAARKVAQALPSPADEALSKLSQEPDLSNTIVDNPSTPKVEPTPLPEGVSGLRVFKSPSEAAGSNYGDIVAAKKVGEKVPEEGRAIAGKAAGSLKKSELANGQIKSAKADLNDPNTSPGVKSAIAQWLDERGGNIGSGQKGEIDPLLLARLASGAISGGIGYNEDPLGNKPLSGAAGAGLGFFGPDLLSRGLPALASRSANTVEKGLDFANRVHNTFLLSPLSVAKKAAGDVGGLTLASIEHPGMAGDIMRQFMSPEGRAAIGEAFRNGARAPENEIATGLDNFVQKGPLSWSGRAMGGLTAGTKHVLGTAGLTPEQQAYYTLTAYPQHDLTKRLYQALSGSKILKHLSPFARIGVNRAERGWEYSPLGLIRSGLSDPAVAKEATKKALIGTGAGAAAYQLTPENFVREHPTVASVGSALGGPLGLPILVGMAMKQSHRNPGEGWGDAFNKFDDASKEVARDIPGLRLIEDMTTRSKEGFLRNYLSGYTNAVRPIATGIDFLNGEKNEPDVSSNNLPESGKIFNRMLSNIPGIRGTLPKKGGEALFGPAEGFDPSDFFKAP